MPWCKWDVPLFHSFLPPIRLVNIDSRVVGTRDIPAIVYPGVRTALASGPLPLRHGRGMGELDVCPGAYFWWAEDPFYTLGRYGEHKKRLRQETERTDAHDGISAKKGN